MPPKKKRGSTQAPKAPPMKRLRKAAGKAGEPDKVTSLFDTYKTAGTDSIGPDGVMVLCRDLGLDPADRKVLILAYKLNAQRQGFFSWEEFRQGMNDLCVSDVSQLRRALDSCERTVLSGTLSSRDFYNYAFKFNLTEPAQKIIDVDTAAQMLNIVIGDKPHVAPFTRYLALQNDYKTINMDQWTGFHRFIQEVKPDCSNYDESQAWPLLLDNYVEWRQKHIS